MLPSGAGAKELQQDFVKREQTSRTYRMQKEEERIAGTIDSLEAMKQTIYKILSTARYKHIIYSWNYGVELVDLIGKPVSYCLPEIERRITEALLQDDRITEVSNFQFETKKRGCVHVTFCVKTTQGELAVEKEVQI